MKRVAAIITLICLFLAASCKQNNVLICEGTSSYAYHNHYCEGLNKCHAAVERISLEKALSLGRKPCHYCYKDKAPVKMQQSTPASNPGQCAAITKKGTRCLRKARSNVYCWQHGG